MPRRSGAGRPAWSAARRARRARDGPILPPAPSTSTSPSISRMKAQSASLGRESSFSRSVTEVMVSSKFRAGHRKLAGSQFVGRRLPAIHAQEGSFDAKAGCFQPTRPLGSEPRHVDGYRRGGLAGKTACHEFSGHRGIVRHHWADLQVQIAGSSKTVTGKRFAAACDPRQIRARGGKRTSAQRCDRRRKPGDRARRRRPGQRLTSGAQLRAWSRNGLVQR